MDSPIVYIPMDRRHALTRGQDLPQYTHGAALFADISGFTPLTEALVRELGPQRGVEELTRYLNLVYDAVIEEVHRFGGSVIAFAGDAITCWFDGDDGLHATAAALAMQQAVQTFATIQTPAGTTVALSMKAAVAAGPVCRFLVGDPDIRILDALAGETLVRLAGAEQQAKKGEVILDEFTWHALGDAIAVASLRRDAETGQQFAEVQGLRCPVANQPWLPLDFDRIDEAQVRPWLLGSVYERLQQGLGDFLAELRPTVALFLRFSGIDYDNDEAAGEKLDAYIRWVQHIVARYAGTVIDLNIGDKGSYLYINFGAPQAHEDNAARAASTALALQAPPPDLDFIEPVQIGISQGRMRAGAYGGTHHRTYGVLGDEVNMAARLMMKAQSGQTVVSEAVQRSIAQSFEFDPLPPMRVKGKSQPATAYVVRNVKQFENIRLVAPFYALPMVGRHAELAAIEQRLQQAAAGRGQVVALVGEPGIGKSRLVAEVVRRAQAQSFSVFGGACESYSVNSSYFVWQPIWRDLMDIDPARPAAEQIEILTHRLREIDPSFVPRLPLLSAVLQLAIPDSDLTRSFDAKLRKSSLESLLVDSLRVLSRRTPMLIVLEDCHWLDSLSYDLLQAIGRAIADQPVYLLLTHRALTLDRLRTGQISNLPHYGEIHLEPFTADEARSLVQLKLAELTGATVPVAESVAHRLLDQSQGNPFYLEELLAYLHYRGVRFDSDAAIGHIEMPDSLHRLVLSRLDQLSEGQQITAKIASIVGRVFRATWLWGAYPALGDPDQVRANLEALQRQELALPDPSEPELTYLFKQVITQNVIYESLPHALRATIHGEIGRFVEEAYAADTLDPYLDLLAHHYDHSDNQAKRREYLRRAGEAAQTKYANQAAIDYYERLLPLLPPDEQIEVIRKLSQVLELMGRWQEAEKWYERALAQARQLNDRSGVAWCETSLGELFRKQGRYEEATQWLAWAQKTFEELNDQAGVGRVLHYAGTLAAQQGDYTRAWALYEESLRLRRQLNDQANIASLLSNLGIVARFQGEKMRAQTLYAESLAIRQQLGDRWAIAVTFNNLGNLSLDLGDLKTARTQFEEAVAIQRQIGDKWGMANSLHNLANTARESGDLNDAGQLYGESLTLWQELGDKWGLAYWLEDVCYLALAEKRYADALILQSASARLRLQINAPLPPTEQEKLDRRLEPARQALDRMAQEDAHRAGRDMTLAQAVAYAMNSTPNIAPTDPVGEAPVEV